MTDSGYMKMALDLARKAEGRTSPNPMVGALIVKNGRIVAKGFHHHCGADHAEIMALKKAKGAARGAKLYVTLEPCSHFGRTPPCVNRIIQSGIKEVIIGTIDPNPRNNGKSLRLLKKAGIKTKVGYLENDLKKLNESFFKYITKGMPFVVAKTAQTLDGKIATAAGQSKWITGPAARNYARRLRNDFDAILVGINTVLADNPRLSAQSKSKQLKKVIIDSKLRIPVKARLFRHTKPEDVIIATTHTMNNAKFSLLRKRGVTVIICPQKDQGINLKWLFYRLAKMEIANLLLEGGAKIIGNAIQEHLVDKMRIFIAPRILGDQGARSSVSGMRVTSVANLPALKDLTVKKIAEDYLFEGYVYGNR